MGNNQEKLMYLTEGYHQLLNNRKSLFYLTTIVCRYPFIFPPRLWEVVEGAALTFSCLMTYIYIYICHTARLTSRSCISYIYSTNIRTEYFEHAAHSPFFPLQNAVYFIMLLFWFLYYSHFKYRMC